ncbi:hypothetical protein [Trichothermofontia sp.]
MLKPHSQLNTPNPSDRSNYDYSFRIKLVFHTIKYTALFLMGISISIIMSMSLQASSITALLTSLFTQAVPPLAIVVLIIIGLAIVFESFS